MAQKTKIEQLQLRMISGFRMQFLSEQNECRRGSNLMNTDSKFHIELRLHFLLPQKFREFFRLLALHKILTKIKF